MIKNTSNKEISFKDIANRYPDFPRFIIFKLELYRRGIVCTDRILERMRKNVMLPLLLRDGSSVLSVLGGLGVAGEYLLDPYKIDLLDGKVGIFDGEEFVDEADFSPEPEFYGKKTSRGTPMQEVASARPQRLDIWAHRFCDFWKGGNQCKFCGVNALFRDRIASTGEISLDPQDVYETVHEALKEPGRFSQITLTGGANQGEDGTFDSETELYIKLLQAIAKNFSSKRFPSQLLSCGLSKKQLKRIHSETGLLSYCPDIEVWDKGRFAWICPGKEKFIGWDGYVRSMLDAVEIFGPGKVYTNIVAGCEMAEPHGFKTEDEALKSNFEGCEYLAKHGVSMMSLVWRPARASLFHRQKQPSLDYYVRLVKGLRDIRAAYGLEVHSDDYKHCGNHADSDLGRID
jgi:hypothetical protein